MVTSDEDLFKRGIAGMDGDAFAVFKQMGMGPFDFGSMGFGSMGTSPQEANPFGISNPEQSKPADQDVIKPENWMAGLGISDIMWMCGLARIDVPVSAEDIKTHLSPLAQERILLAREELNKTPEWAGMYGTPVHYEMPGTFASFDALAMPQSNGPFGGTPAHSDLLIQSIAGFDPKPMNGGVTPITAPADQPPMLAPPHPSGH